MRSPIPLTVAIAACLYILSAGTPASAAGSLRGVWRGAWENSLGERGEGRLVVTREDGDLVSGEWDGDPFEGRREGNEIVFTIRGAQKGCTNYDGRMVFFEDGVGGRLTYSAHNHCTDRRYSGSQRLRLEEGR